MSDLRVSTQAVINDATRINNINDDINRSFVTCRNSVNALSSSWTSTSSRTIIGKFFSAEQKFSAPRSQKVKDFTNFLTSQVAPGYEITETQNKNWAEEFK